MDTFIYIVLGVSSSAVIFTTGLQFGVWLDSLNSKTDTKDCNTDEFYENYYAGSCCKDKHLYDKPAKKKPTKKGNK